MSTKTQTNSTESNAFQFNPASLSAYNQLQPNIIGTLQQYMANPLTSSFFNTRVGMGNKQISQQQSGVMNSLLNNFKTQGFTGASPSAFTQSQMANIARQTSGLKANNFNTQLLAANQQQLQATGMSQAYQPLLTGSNATGQQTTQQSGLGTWLPQLIGAGLGAATSAFTGGASSAGGGGTMFGGATGGGAGLGSMAGVTNPLTSLGGGAMGPSTSPLMNNPFSSFLTPSPGGYY